MSYKTILPLIFIQFGLLMALEAQSPAPRPAAKLVAVGEIAKINPVKRSLELKSMRDTRGQPNSSGEFDVDIAFGGRDPRTVEASHGNPHEDPFPPDRTSRVEFIITTVFLTDNTVCKERDKTILCTDLKVTDNLRVTGDERREARGKGLYASEIVRTPLRQPQPIR